MTLLIIKNISGEGPGLLEEALKEYRVPYEVVDLSFSDNHFPQPHFYSGVVVLGGPQSVNDETPHMSSLLRRVKETVDAGIPYLGICLGMQALAKVCGGKVDVNPVQEVGFKDQEGNYFSVEFTEEGKRDLLLHGLPSPMRIFHLHAETASLGEGVTLLASGKHCANQMIRVGNNAYGIQGHVEMTEKMLTSWMATDENLKRQDKDSVLDAYGAIRKGYEANGRILFTNFLKIANMT